MPKLEKIQDELFQLQKTIIQEIWEFPVQISLIYKNSVIQVKFQMQNEKSGFLWQQ